MTLRFPPGWIMRVPATAEAWLARDTVEPNRLGQNGGLGQLCKHGSNKNGRKA